MPRAWPIAARMLGGRPSAACLALLASLVAAAARAEDMDPALERLGGGSDCEGTAATCPDQARFERLASELAVATVLPAIGPAATLGAGSFGLGLGSTITSIDSGAEHWQLGTRGNDVAGPANGRNSTPMPVLVWNRLEARKGLPFGFEIGIDLAQGLRTSFWTPSVWLKWSLFEGFRTRYGPLPELAVRAGYGRSVGSSELGAQTASFDLALSRSFVVSHAWSLTPFVDWQLLLAHVESAVIDFTPGSDAFGACAPDAAHPPRPGARPDDDACTGSAADFANSAAFDDVDQARVRIAVGGEASWSMWRARLLLHYDLLAPELEASGGETGLRQLAFDVTFGVVL